MHNDSVSAMSLSAWTALLSVSTRFDMARVRSRAIKEIDEFHPSIDPVEKVVLAVKYNVPEWLRGHMLPSVRGRLLLVYRKQDG